MPTTRATSTSAAGDVSIDIAAGPDQTPVQPSNSWCNQIRIKILATLKRKISTHIFSIENNLTNV